MVPLHAPKTARPPDAEALKRKALGALSDLPPFSAILNRVLASLAGENVSFSRLGDLIEKDTVVAGNLLYLVNSALYARSGTINSVRHALSLLGIDKVRNAVLGMSITRMWKKAPVPAAWSMARFNLHSAAVAILSDLLAQRLRVEYPEGAFVAGLLHDIGRLVIALGLPDKHQRISCLQTAGHKHLDCELEVLGFNHAELSADTLAVWNLPAPILVAVRHHHSPQMDPAEPDSIALSHVLQAANNYVNASGVSIDIANGLESADPSLVESLGLGDRLPAILEEFTVEYEAMATFFH